MSDVLADVKGTCLVYVSDDGLYMREEEAIEQCGIPPCSKWTHVIVQLKSRLRYWTPDGSSAEPIETRQFRAQELPIPGPIPTGPAGDAIVSELLGREVRHWKRED